ncbi:MAG: large subunit ribosomal protein [Clostridia bacterium]|nr:large subunit ribosomal protein [Clostridia bacterium]
MFKRIDRKEKRKSKHLRVRRRIEGTPERPRLSVYRSLHHIYAQIIDDTKGITLVAASTNEKGMRDQESTKNKEAAMKVGELIAKRAQAKGIDKVVFDRGGNIYHGRIAAVAEGARKGGLEF